jgi:mRNA-degrading endonuclease RelE of RelBE toxin-antitoxin system
MLRQIQSLRKRIKIDPEPLKGGMAGFFRLGVNDYRILYQPLVGKLILIHDVRRRANSTRKPAEDF